MNFLGLILSDISKFIFIKLGKFDSQFDVYKCLKIFVNVEPRL